jgi:HSP20 family molecular chaperone IbpA
VAGFAEKPYNAQLPVERWIAVAGDAGAAGLREADLWWDVFGRVSGRDWDVSRANDCSSSVDVVMDDHVYLFMTWFPGLRSGDLRVVVHEHDHASEGRPKRRQRIGIVVHRVCAPRGLCCCVTVPATVDIEHVEAQLWDGMLIVRVPVG